MLRNLTSTLAAPSLEEALQRAAARHPSLLTGGGSEGEVGAAARLKEQHRLGLLVTLTSVTTAGLGGLTNFSLVSVIAGSS